MVIYLYERNNLDLNLFNTFNKGIVLFRTRYENVFAHIVAVIRLHPSKKNNPLLIFTLLKSFLDCILIFLIINYTLSFK